MIISFLHKGLERFHEMGDSSGIQSRHIKRISRILSILDVAESPQDMNLPGLRLHELKGNRKSIWSVTVSRSWRITFRFTNRNVEIVNYEDYH